MRICLVIVICLLSPLLKSQGFERVIHSSNRHIWEIHLSAEGGVALVSGQDPFRLSIQSYTSETDSLGPSRPYRGSGYNDNGAYINYHSFSWGENRWVVYRNDNAHALGRLALNISIYYQNDGQTAHHFRPPYFSPSFNPILVNDTLFGYRGEAIDFKHPQSFTANDTLIRFYFDLENDTIQDLDTVILPLIPQFPGDLHYLPESRQNLLVFDSLMVFLSPGHKNPDSVLNKESTSFGGVDMLYHHHYLQSLAGPYGITKVRRVWDTLDMIAVDFYTEALGNKRKVSFPKLDVERSWSSLAPRPFLKMEMDSSLTMGFYERTNQGNHSAIRLYRIEGEELVRQAHYSAPAEFNRIEFNALASDTLGNFYLSLWYFPDDLPNLLNSMLVKLDSNNFSRPLIPPQDFELFHYRGAYSERSKVYFILPNHQDQAYYQICDAYGKVYAEGKARSRELIDIVNMEAGSYFIRLWLDELFLGTKAIIIY